MRKHISGGFYENRKIPKGTWLFGIVFCDIQLEFAVNGIVQCIGSRCAVAGIIHFNGKLIGMTTRVLININNTNAYCQVVFGLNLYLLQFRQVVKIIVDLELELIRRV